MTLFERASWIAYERARARYESLRRRHRPRSGAYKRMKRILHNIMREELRHG